MKILIAVPTFENICPDTFKSIYDLDKGGHEVSFEFVRGYDCARARNEICLMGIKRKMDYVLMVDNDVILPKDTLIRLLRSGAEVCLGHYPHRAGDNTYKGKSCIMKIYDKDGREYFDFPYESLYDSKELLAKEGLVHVRAGGLGCALIRVSVFEKLAFPYFNWINYQNKHTLSEDLYFSVQLKGAGVPIYCDPKVACGHLLRHFQWPV